MKAIAALAGIVVCGACFLVLAGCNGQQVNWPDLINRETRSGSKAGSDAGPLVIMLTEHEGANRMRQAEQLKNTLVDRGWGGVGVLHASAEQRSYVYLGPFKAEEVEATLKQARGYTDASGARPFVGAYQRRLPPPNPEAPREWNLVNAPIAARYSLQIGHFIDPGPAWPTLKLVDLPAGWNRKQAAVDACVELRKQGLDAFYYHGPNMSLLTLGAFPQEAFMPNPTRPRELLYDAERDEYLDQRISSVRNIKKQDKDGREDTPFRYNLQNGLKLIKRQRFIDGQVRDRVEPSFLIEIPRPHLDIE